MSGKPEYKVPTMKQINRLPWNGYNVVSTFSGGGGSSTGYRMAGYRVAWANEFVEAAQDTYRANMSRHTHLSTEDIRNVTGKALLSESGLSHGSIDLFDGSPPCASFSMAGNREKDWGKVKKYSDKEQRTDDLFFEYIRLISETMPKTFVAENVAGLARGIAVGYLLKILKQLRDIGYQVQAKTLDAQWLGVPQSRKRLIIIGVRNDLQQQPKYPAPLRYSYTIKDAIPNCIMAKFGRSGWKLSNRPSTTVSAQRTWNAKTSGQGCELARFRGNGKTIERVFNTEEIKAICSFPSDFIITGDTAQQWERCGRSVPPVMMRHIAKAVQGVLDAAR